MPICPNCGSQIPEESDFFPDFEKTIVLEATSQPPPYVALEKPKLSRLGHKLVAVAIIMLLAGVGIGYGVHPSPSHIDKRRFCYG